MSIQDCSKTILISKARTTPAHNFISTALASLAAFSAAFFAAPALGATQSITIASNQSFEYRYYSKGQKAEIIGIATFKRSRPGVGELCQTREWSVLHPNDASKIGRIPVTVVPGLGGGFRLKRADIESGNEHSPDYHAGTGNEGEPFAVGWWDYQGSFATPRGDSEFADAGQWPTAFIPLPEANHVPFPSEWDADDLRASQIKRVDLGAFEAQPIGKLNLQDLLVVVRTKDVPAIQRFLLSQGDGARLLNDQLAACGSGTFATRLIVPPHMESWYAGKLKQQWLVLFATRTFHEDIGLISVGVPDRAVINTFFDWRAPEQVRSKAVGAYVRTLLLSFARARRVDFARGGTVTELTAPMRNVWAFEVTGPSLTSCSRSKWEKLHAEVTYVQGDGEGLLELANDFDKSSLISAGGVSLPALNHPIDDFPLSRLDDLFDGYLLANGFKSTDTTQARPLKNVRCPGA